MQSGHGHRAQLHAVVANSIDNMQLLWRQPMVEFHVEQLILLGQRSHAMCSHVMLAAVSILVALIDCPFVCFRLLPLLVLFSIFAACTAARSISYPGMIMGSMTTESDLAGGHLFVTVGAAVHVAIAVFWKQTGQYLFEIDEPYWNGRGISMGCNGNRELLVHAVNIDGYYSNHIKILDWQQQEVVRTVDDDEGYSSVLQDSSAVDCANGWIYTTRRGSYVDKVRYSDGMRVLRVALSAGVYALSLDTTAQQLYASVPTIGLHVYNTTDLSLIRLYNVSVIVDSTKQQQLLRSVIVRPEISRIYLFIYDNVSSSTRYVYNIICMCACFVTCVYSYV